MGREDKKCLAAAQSKGVRGNGKRSKSKEVSDAEISKLLQHFTSAELFPQSSSPSHPKSGGTKGEDRWHEVVTSFKHLHVRRPQRTKQRRAQQNPRVGKQANVLNLAIAAGNLHKPLVWPAKLHCSECKKLSGSILLPARLRIPASKTDSKSKGKNSVASACCSCKLKARRESKQKLTRGGHHSGSFGQVSTSTSQSFSDLVSATGKSDGAHSPATGGTNKARVVSSNTPSISSFPGQQLFTHTTLQPQTPPTNSPSLQPQSGTSLSHHRDNNSAASRLSSSPSSFPPLPSATGSPSTRSCSQQVRDMEETNVTELASYLEELLHIPRKMSTMAEMMYA